MARMTLKRWLMSARLPDDMPLDYGALLEPLGVAIHAVRRASFQPGSRVLIFGAGAVGLLCAAMARISGASRVVIADIDAGRTNFAAKNNFAHAGYTVSTRRGQTVEENLSIATELADSICKENLGDEDEAGGFDIAFECTGVPSCLQSSIYATRPGGKIMLIGMGTPIQTLPISAAHLREVDLIGVFRYANTYPEGIKVLSRKEPGYPEFSKLVTHRYTGLESAPEAFAMAAKTKDEKGNLVLKVMLETQEEERRP